ncbi:SRPBCC domain-containing protein [Actinomycetospora soli]|uniref:SRPBCC domain-containing protein n=1 Tax=Actinomycetospora soli TaxID=2893887 RepID=UPI001E4EE557|nr:SRPBCC domain-containing protein [Actinomycetospora soli]MCD2187351.1 SRPBCC domain-containing protein [Actinomycetospora soli]
MARTDRAARVISADPERVHAALVDPDALVTWLPPEGMRGRIERWDLRPGGGFRMELTYLDAAGAPGKSTAATDVVEVGFGEVTAHRVEWRTEFVADDPAFAGVMTMTWSLRPAGSGTEVVVTADDVPPGIGADVHEEAMASSLANLAAAVER